MAFSISKMMVAAGVATGALISVASSASAQSFGFQFQNNLLVNNSPKGDVLLESVKIGNEIITELSFVSGVKIVQNDPFEGGNTGAASADRGDRVTTGAKVEDATAADILTNLSTNNLNHIIDTEDSGNFIIDLTFGKTIDNLLIWERGTKSNGTAGNSDLGIQAVDAFGNLIGNRLVVQRNMWFDAGYAIDTTEIDGAQKVGSLGINILEDFGVESGAVSTIRFFSKKEFNGPDWKFVGTDATRDVPEPAFVLGLGILAGTFILQKRSRIA